MHSKFISIAQIKTSDYINVKIWTTYLSQRISKNLWIVFDRVFCLKKKKRHKIVFKTFLEKVALYQGLRMFLGMLEKPFYWELTKVRQEFSFWLRNLAEIFLRKKYFKYVSDSNKFEILLWKRHNYNIKVRIQLFRIFLKKTEFLIKVKFRKNNVVCLLEPWVDYVERYPTYLT